MSRALRVSRTRVPQLQQEFEINFKLKVGGQGVTKQEAADFVAECMRYSAAAHIFQIPHPTGEADWHGRGENAPYDGIVDLVVK